MDIKEAIEHAKHKPGLKQSVSGLFSRSAEMLEEIGEDRDGCDFGAGYAFSLRQMSEHYEMARTAFMNGELETVAEFFGLYV
jgi:hypothetical protein